MILCERGKEITFVVEVKMAIICLEIILITYARNHQKFIVFKQIFCDFENLSLGKYKRKQ